MTTRQDILAISAWCADNWESRHDQQAQQAIVVLGFIRPNPLTACTSEDFLKTVWFGFAPLKMWSYLHLQPAAYCAKFDHVPEPWFPPGVLELAGHVSLFPISCAHWFDHSAFVIKFIAMHLSPRFSNFRTSFSSSCRTPADGKTQPWKKYRHAPWWKHLLGLQSTEFPRLVFFPCLDQLTLGIRAIKLVSRTLRASAWTFLIFHCFGPIFQRISKQLRGLRNSDILAKIGFKSRPFKEEGQFFRSCFALGYWVVDSHLIEVEDWKDSTIKGLGSRRYGQPTSHQWTQLTVTDNCGSNHIRLSNTAPAAWESRATAHPWIDPAAQAMWEAIPPRRSYTSVWTFFILWDVWIQFSK